MISTVKAEFYSPVDGAKYMYNLGLSVMRLRPGQKEPQEKNWPQLALDEITMDNGGTPCGQFFNFGVNTDRSRLLVVDVDYRQGAEGPKGRDPWERWHEFRNMHSIPDVPTFTVRTPRGGLHLYFFGIGPTTANKFKDGIDTRGIGGYVVAPASIFEGQIYTIEVEVKIASAPDELISAFAQSAAVVLEAPQGVELDNLKEIEAAKVWLGGIKPAIQGEGGDNYTYWVCCELKDKGMTLDTSYELLQEHFNERCVPPWSAEALKAKIENAWRHGQNAPGSKTEEATLARVQEDFSTVPLPDLANPELAKRKEIAPLPLVSSSKTFENITPLRDWIIMNSILGGFITITGAPGATGKSNYEILRALSIVTGRQLVAERNLVVKTGPVVLYNCEDPLEEMERRVKAFCTYLAIPANAVKDLYLVSGRDHSLCVAGVNQKGEVAVNDNAVETLIATVQSVGAVLLSVDPLVRAHGLSENDNMAMDKVTQAFQRVSSATGCGVSILHHTNKEALNTKKGHESASQAVYRGAGSLVASARIGEILTTMNESEASSFGIPTNKRRFYFKVENAKANLGPPPEFADWYESVGQEIDNGEVVGVCRVVKLTKMPKVKKAPVNAMAREEALTYLRSKVPETGTDVEQVKEGLRVLCGLKTSRTAAVIGAVEEILGDQNEFRFTQSAPRKPYRIERAEAKIPLQNLH